MKEPSAEHMMDFVEIHRRGSNRDTSQASLQATLPGKEVIQDFNPSHERIIWMQTLQQYKSLRLDFRNMTVEQRQVTSKRLKACGNCLREDHTSCSKRSCWTCGRSTSQSFTSTKCCTAAPVPTAIYYIFSTGERSPVQSCIRN